MLCTRTRHPVGGAPSVCVEVGGESGKKKYKEKFNTKGAKIFFFLQTFTSIKKSSKKFDEVPARRARRVGVV